MGCDTFLLAGVRMLSIIAEGDAFIWKNFTPARALHVGEAARSARPCTRSKVTREVHAPCRHPLSQDYFTFRGDGPEQSEHPACGPIL
jgi:hypothetical protein